MSKRLLYIDYTKGFGTILLLFAHTMNIEEHYIGIWISSFFMPLFFVTSGVILYLKFGEKLPSCFDLLSLLRKRLFQLGIPYVVFSLLLLFFYLSLSIISKSEIDILYYLFRIISLKGIDSLWFIPVFFFAELLFVILLMPPRIGKWIRIIAFIVGVIFVGLNLKSDNFFVLFIIRLIVCVVFVYFGFLFSKFRIVHKANIVISFLLIACGIPLAINNGPIGLAVLNLNNGWLFLLTALLNCTGIILFLYFWEQKNIRLQLLEIFGKNSIVILCTNNLLIEIIRLLDTKITNNLLFGLGVIGSVIFTAILLVIELGIIRLSQIKGVSVLFGKRNR